IEKLRKAKKNMIPGEFAFKLYDTYGFPVDLTRLMATEQGIAVDEVGFDKNMDEARKRSQASWKGQALNTDQGHLIELSQNTKPTEFIGYASLAGQGKVLALSDGHKSISKLSSGESGIAIFDKTPFYAEGGGQIGDNGTLSKSNFNADVLDCTKNGDVYMHQITVT